eukprot:SAG11_NODE_591_length_8314_cov_3.988314_1_plen_74_part_00
MMKRSALLNQVLHGGSVGGWMKRPPIFNRSGDGHWYRRHEGGVQRDAYAQSEAVYRYNLAAVPGVPSTRGSLS